MPADRWTFHYDVPGAFEVADEPFCDDVRHKCDLTDRSAHGSSANGCTAVSTPSGRRTSLRCLVEVRIEGLSLHILQLFARALGLDDHYFDGKVDRHTSTMRVIYYPPQAEAPAPGQLRAGEHTDYGTVTILKGEDVPGGLQVKRRNGGW